MAASYLTTVTNLTVTGTIDARDFKTMCDNMPSLEVIDLSGTTIAAYTGAEGTKTWSLAIYPAGAIPDNAFYNPSTYMGKQTLKAFIGPASVTTIGQDAFSDCICNKSDRY